MFNYLEKLRGKSDSAKKRFAFLFSFLFVGIIFVVWLSVVFPNFQQEKNIADRVSAGEPSPLSTFTSIISQGSQAIGGQISAMRELGASFLSGTEYISTATTTGVTTQ